MLASPLEASLILSLCVLFVVGLEYRRRAARKLPLPPGPPPLPLVGNILDVPKSICAEEYNVLSMKYGDIVHLNVLGQHMIILGSFEAASELLDKRSANYSGKPASAMADLIGLDWNVALLGNGETWRKHRKEFHRFFSITAVARYNNLIEIGARRFLRKLLENPAAFSEHAQFSFGATVMRVVYGIEVESKEDQYLSLAEEGNDIFQKAFVPGKYLVETFPILKHVPAWLPGAGFRRDATAWSEIYYQTRFKPFQATIERMHRDGPDSSMVSTMMRGILEGEKVTAEDEIIARDVAGAIYLAGAETTLTAIRLFFLAVLTHPEVQKRAQEELDAVVGLDRLPTLNDRPSLPYIEAMVRECLRWRPILPLALPRTSQADDEYQGYLIPKGSIVLANSWIFSRDPRYYPQPERFMPERFLKDGKLDPDVRDPRVFAFGYGRRICPGRHFGEASVFINIASVLHSFTIEPPLDKAGKPFVPDVKMTTGFLSCPEPFDCRITPRSRTAESLMVADGVDAVERGE
ncbi:CyP450 monooxygenase [Lentinus tigrinus ALCF2SS1-6]|uniref:CyP450 monooxygenase n=2 Tax=Lentinus tigrinus TaxID=5365 RepID=A0A5C2RRR5_9APHY|nr:CyP450 monooxygenase [Lentinus tigrinus ALCF2SS1-6]